MGLLNLSGILKTAGAGFAGYGADKQQAVQQAIQQRAADRQARLDGIQELIAARTLRTPVLGDPGYAKAMGDVAGAEAGARVQPAIDQARGMIPVKVDEQNALEPGAVRQAVDTAKGVAPVTETTHAAERDYDNAHPAPDKPIISIQQPLQPGEPAQVVAVDPNDPTHPRVAPIPGVSKGGSSTVGSGIGSLSPQALAGMSKQALDADKVMTAFEKKYAADPSIVGAGSGLAASASNAQGGGVLAGAQRLAGNIALGQTNPEYQQYLAAQKRFGNIMGNLMSRRYTEHQGVLDTDLSGLQSGDVLSTLALKQNYRRDLLDHFPVGGETGVAHAAGSNDPAFDALMAKWGKKP